MGVWCSEDNPHISSPSLLDPVLLRQSGKKWSKARRIDLFVVLNHLQGGINIVLYHILHRTENNVRQTMLSPSQRRTTL